MLLIGCVSVFESSSVIFDWGNARASHGNYVLFVVYANWVCCLIFIFAAIALWRKISWSKIALGLASLLMIATFIKFRIYINEGGIYETKTEIAMTVRSLLTLIFFFSTLWIAKNQK